MGARRQAGTPFGALAVLLALTACGPTAEEQRAMDNQRCSGFGFAPGSDSFAACMMNVTQQREAQQAADRRAAASRDAADKRFQDAQKAARDRADQDAWDRRTGQGVYSSSSRPSPFSSSPVDSVQESIERDMRKIESGE